MRKRPPHVDGGFYHVSLRGNARQAIFRDSQDRATLEECIANALQRYDSELHAYCWMTNHLHLLIRVTAEPAQHAVRHFATSYARQFNFKYQSVGHVFQGRHHRRYVDSDAYLKQVVRYIHRNPVEAGMCDMPVDYPWSSHRVYLSIERREFLNTSFVLAQFGQNPPAAKLALVDFINKSSVEPNPWSTWKEIVLAAEVQFGISESELRGDGRGRRLAESRCWVARHALDAELGSISQIAGKFGRSASGLSRMLRRRTGGKVSND